MTRYERQTNYQEGDKVWVYGLDQYTRSYNNGDGNVLFSREKKYDYKKRGVIVRQNTYLTTKDGKTMYKCYKVKLNEPGRLFFRDVSECLIERRK